MAAATTSATSVRLTAAIDQVIAELDSIPGIKPDGMQQFTMCHFKALLDKLDTSHCWILMLFHRRGSTL